MALAKSIKTKYNFTYDLVIIVFLLFLFPLVWIYNQRLNCRKVFTLNTKFSLNANEEKTSQLSSPTFILRYFNAHGINATLSPKVINSPNFSLVGRIIETKFGNIEVYEYGSKSDAAKQIKFYEKDLLTYGAVKDLVLPYKNLLICNKNNSQEINSLVEKLKK